MIKGQLFVCYDPRAYPPKLAKMAKNIKNTRFHNKYFLQDPLIVIKGHQFVRYDPTAYAAKTYCTASNMCSKILKKLKKKPKILTGSSNGDKRTTVCAL